MKHILSILMSIMLLAIPGTYASRNKETFWEKHPILTATTAGALYTGWIGGFNYGMAKLKDVSFPDKLPTFAAPAWGCVSRIAHSFAQRISWAMGPIWAGRLGSFFEKTGEKITPHITPYNLVHAGIFVGTGFAGYRLAHYYINLEKKLAAAEKKVRHRFPIFSINK